jgi:HPt (histidine-containing phosphotransfer) domain-containing protein
MEHTLDQTSDKDELARPNRIVSLLGDDPDLKDLVDDFVTAMPERIASIYEAINAHDSLGLQRLMHQLKGACGSYGFPQLTEEAAVLEKLLHRGAGLSEVKELVMEFIRKLSRIATR